MFFPCAQLSLLIDGLHGPFGHGDLDAQVWVPCTNFSAVQVHKLPLERTFHGTRSWTFSGFGETCGEPFQHQLDCELHVL